MPKPRIANYNGIFPTRLREIMDGNYNKGYGRCKRTNTNELAEACNISRQSIAKYRDGNATPSTDNLAKIAKHLQVSTDYLLGLSDHENFEKTQKDFEIYKTLLSRVDKCDPLAKKSFITLFDDLITCYQRLGEDSQALQQITSFFSTLISHLVRGGGENGNT